MKKLSEIETDVKFLTGSRQISLTDTDGLALVNRVYRRLAAALPWAEFRVSDTSIVTVAAQENYAWPTAQVWRDVTLVEMHDAATVYKPVPECKEEYLWNLARREPAASFPRYYTRGRSAAAIEILFAPTPRFAGRTVRLTGHTEPTPLLQAEEPTVFLALSADDALAYLAAGAWADHDKGKGAGDDLRGGASRILSDLFGRDVLPAEL